MNRFDFENLNIDIAPVEPRESDHITQVCHTCDKEYVVYRRVDDCICKDCYDKNKKGLEE